jgi:aminoglycoside phosphotransferase (APT) family kinase protein
MSGTTGGPASPKDSDRAPQAGSENARVRAAFAAFGIEASSITPLAGVSPFTAVPRSYLVTAADGSHAKIRFGRSPALAERAARLTACLADARVPVPSARAGAVTLERWVEGTVLTSLALTAEHVDAAVDLLVSIHRWPGVSEERLPREQMARPVLRRAERQLSELVAAGIFSTTESLELCTILREGLAATSRWGLLHGDFCGENLVWRPDRTLVSIDNEAFRRGFLEYDLARTCYRWPMPTWASDRFCRRYRSAFGLEPPPATERRAWLAAAAVKGVHLRHRRGVPANRALAVARSVLDQTSELG